MHRIIKFQLTNRGRFLMIAGNSAAMTGLFRHVRRNSHGHVICRRPRGFHLKVGLADGHLRFDGKRPRPQREASGKGNGLCVTMKGQFTDHQPIVLTGDRARFNPARYEPRPWILLNVEKIVLPQVFGQQRDFCRNRIHINLENQMSIPQSRVRTIKSADKAVECAFVGVQERGADESDARIPWGKNVGVRRCRRWQEGNLKRTRIHRCGTHARRTSANAYTENPRGNGRQTKNCPVHSEFREESRQVRNRRLHPVESACIDVDEIGRHLVIGIDNHCIARGRIQLVFVEVVFTCGRVRVTDSDAGNF